MCGSGDVGGTGDRVSESVWKPVRALMIGQVGVGRDWRQCCKVRE